MKNKLTNFAKKLRKEQTDAEKALWKHLRNKQAEGFKFRRQQPIGNYIVDFICFERKLIIEVDGEQHALAEEKDKPRDKCLSNQGYTILRFWNNELLKNKNGVLETIREKLSL